MRIHLLGVRGSTAAPGPEYVVVGGHTSCVALVATGDEHPTVVLDAGTGLQRLSGLLGGEPYRGSVLLTHVHWDHTHGLPFFPAGDREDARVDVLLPRQSSADAPDDALSVMGLAMSPPHFPIGPDGLHGRWSWEGIDPGPRRVEGLTVQAFEVPHKGGRTFGYRVADPAGGSLAYVPDHLPRAAGPDPRIVGHLRGVDVLIHDAQFTGDEAATARRFGHSTIDQALAIARAAGVGRLVLFHHGPTRSDEDVAQIERRAAAAAADGGPGVVAAREGTVNRHRPGYRRAVADLAPDPLEPDGSLNEHPRTALVLGATSDIGAAILGELAAGGLRSAVLAARDPEAAAAVVAEAAPGLTTEAIGWDALEVESHRALFERAAESLGGIDVVICAVGLLGHHAGRSMGPVDVEHMVRTNFAGPAAALAAAGQFLVEQGHGTIVLLSSVAGLRARRSNYVYGSTKAGLDVFAQGLADSLVGTGVRCVVVRPGFVRSRMTDGLDPAPFSTDPATVARATVAAIRDPRRELIHVPRVLGPLFGVIRAMPRSVWRTIAGDR